MKQLGTRIDRKGLQLFGVLLVALLGWCETGNAQTWISPTRPPQFNVGIALQLTDGTIMVQEANTSNWWKLTPDINGFYRFGTWTQLASFPSSMGYAPLYFASAVLPDGRVIVEGGEYNAGVKDWTNLGAIYDPVADTWTQVNAPPGWSQIGDAQSVVLPDGTFMLANISDRQVAQFDESTLSWTLLNGPSKFDHHDEEGWTLLPGGNVLTVDTYTGVVNNPNGTNSEIWDYTTGTWGTAGSTIVPLWDSRVTCGGTKSTHEVGPAVLRPNGTVFALGANTCPSSAGQTAIYNSSTKVWTAGPDIPGSNDAADAPAALLPDGNVLVDVNPGYGKNPSTLYEYSFSGAGWVVIPQPIGLNPSNTEGARMLVTADGTILLTHVDTPQMWFYIPAGTFKKKWRPTLSSCPSSVTIGTTYTLSGTQFNGLSQGSAFGDDAQSATNYPIVRIQNNSTLHYFFQRSHDFSTMDVATGSAIVSTDFDVVAGTEVGPSTLQVIANGIPSLPCNTTVKRVGE